MPGKLSDEDREALESDARKEQGAQEEVRRKEAELKEVDARMESARAKQKEMQDARTEIDGKERNGELTKEQAGAARKNCDENEVRYIQEEQALKEERETKAKELEEARRKAEREANERNQERERSR